MITQPYRLYAERTDASKNMARYYAMEISATLFGQTCLTGVEGASIHPARHWSIISIEKRKPSNSSST